MAAGDAPYPSQRDDAGLACPGWRGCSRYDKGREAKATQMIYVPGPGAAASPSSVMTSR
jgi:hypothetical protein